MLPNVSAPSEYGLPKSDYDSNGVVDPETECLAAEYEAMGVDVAALTHVSPKAIVVCTVAGGVVTIAAYRSVWGDEMAVQPSVVYNAAGDYTFTWAVGGYPDLNPTVARRVTRAPNLIAGVVVPSNSVNVHGVNVSVTANVATVELVNAANVNMDANFTLWVY